MFIMNMRALFLYHVNNPRELVFCTFEFHVHDPIKNKNITHPAPISRHGHRTATPRARPEPVL